MGEIRTLTQLTDLLKQGWTVSGGRIVPPQKPQAAYTPQGAERRFCISVAGHILGIEAAHTFIRSRCGDYLCGGEPETWLRVSESDLEFERDKADDTLRTKDEGFLENQAFLRRISEKMLDWDAFLMHGAVTALDGAAYMFTAESGTGKTTHIKKWLENAEGAYVVNGDKPLIRITSDAALACGTPWCGKEHMGTNAMVPLRAIALMERGENNNMEEISFGKAFPFLLRQTYRPLDTEKMKKTLLLLSRLNGKTRFFRFVFNNMKPDAFSVAYRAMTGKSAAENR